jgi:hypothetical protein
VQITSHGADDDFAGRLHVRLYQVRLQQRQAVLHGARRDQHLGHEVFALFKEAAHLLHSADHALIEDDTRIELGVERSLDISGHFIHLAVEHAVVDFLQAFIHEIVPFSQLHRACRS